MWVACKLQAFSGFEGSMRLPSSGPAAALPPPGQALPGSAANTSMMDIGKGLHQTAVPQFGANIFDY